MRTGPRPRVMDKTGPETFILARSVNLVMNFLWSLNPPQGNHWVHSRVLSANSQQFAITVILKWALGARSKGFWRRASAKPVSQKCHAANTRATILNSQPKQRKKDGGDREGIRQAEVRMPWSQ